MTIWHVQKLYTSEGCSYEVLPYNFIGTIKVTLKMKNGIWQMIKFLLDGRLTENKARKLAKKIKAKHSNNLQFPCIDCKKSKTMQGFYEGIHRGTSNRYCELYHREQCYGEAYGEGIWNQ